MGWVDGYVGGDGGGLGAVWRRRGQLCGGDGTATAFMLMRVRLSCASLRKPYTLHLRHVHSHT